MMERKLHVLFNVRENSDNISRRNGENLHGGWYQAEARGDAESQDDEYERKRPVWLELFFKLNIYFVFFVYLSVSLFMFIVLSINSYWHILVSLASLKIYIWNWPSRLDKLILSYHLKSLETQAALKLSYIASQNISMQLNPKTRLEDFFWTKFVFCPPINISTVRGCQMPLARDLKREIERDLNTFFTPRCLFPFRRNWYKIFLNKL